MRIADDDPERTLLGRDVGLLEHRRERSADIGGERGDVVYEECSGVGGTLVFTELGGSQRGRLTHHERRIGPTLIMEGPRDFLVLGPSLTDDHDRNAIARETSDDVHDGDHVWIARK